MFQRYARIQFQSDKKIGQFFNKESSLHVEGTRTSECTDSCLIAHEEIDVPSGFLLTRVRAISARVNKNFDGFTSSELKKAYKTFEGKPVFVNHVNHDVKRARGSVAMANYHEHGKDKYIECLMLVDGNAYPKLAKEIMADNLDSVSMGCNIEKSRCSVCKKEASNQFEFCDHVLNYKGQKIGGQLVYEECLGISFFELSYVFDPADETAVMQEVHVGAVDSDDNLDISHENVGINLISADHVGNRLSSNVAFGDNHAERDAVRLISASRSKRVSAKVTNNFVVGSSMTVQSLAMDDVVSPLDVDTLRTEEMCPECGADDFDGQECSECGHVPPIEELDEPNVDSKEEPEVKEEPVDEDDEDKEEVEVDEKLKKALLARRKKSDRMDSVTNIGTWTLTDTLADTPAVSGDLQDIADALHAWFIQGTSGDPSLEKAMEDLLFKAHRGEPIDAEEDFLGVSLVRTSAKVADWKSAPGLSGQMEYEIDGFIGGVVDANEFWYELYDENGSVIGGEPISDAEEGMRKVEEFWEADKFIRGLSSTKTAAIPAMQSLWATDGSKWMWIEDEFDIIIDSNFDWEVKRSGQTVMVGMANDFAGAVTQAEYAISNARNSKIAGADKIAGASTIDEVLVDLSHLSNWDFVEGSGDDEHFSYYDNIGENDEEFFAEIVNTEWGWQATALVNGSVVAEGSRAFEDERDAMLDLVNALRASSSLSAYFSKVAVAVDINNYGAVPANILREVADLDNHGYGRWEFIERADQGLLSVIKFIGDYDSNAVRFDMNTGEYSWSIVTGLHNVKASGKATSFLDGIEQIKANGGKV